jgi:hypothetical protein
MTQSDIGHATVVWAREIPGENLTPLLDYFSDRRVCVVDADKLSAQPKPLQAMLSVVPPTANKDDSSAPSRYRRGHRRMCPEARFRRALPTYAEESSHARHLVGRSRKTADKSSRKTTDHALEGVSSA